MRPDRFYTPGRIRHYLPLLRTHENRLVRLESPPEGEQTGHSNASFAWQENQLAIAADLMKALDSLDWFTRACVWDGHVLLIQDTEAAINHRCDPETVSRRRNKGIYQMAEYLGWTDDQAPPRPPSPTSWRKDDSDE